MRNATSPRCPAFAFSLLLVACQVLAAVPIPQAIQNAPQNSWIRLNANRFSDAWAPSELTYFNTKAVIEAWSSFAWDSTRGNVILWGGGHANYAGNEVYLWKSSSGLWERGSLSSAAVADPNVTARFETVDGPLHSPISMHTYDGNIYLPRLDRFLTFGGPQYNAGGAGGNLYENGVLRWTGPYLWDPAKADPWKAGGLSGSHIVSTAYPAGSIAGGSMWENRDSWPRGIPPSSDRAFSSNFSAYADESGKDIVYLSSGRALWRFTIQVQNDPGQDLYELVGIYDAGLHPHGSGSYNQARRLWVELRGSDLVYYDLSTQGIAIGRIFNNRIVYSVPADQGTFNFGSLVWPTLGDRYGLDYDPARDRFLLWEGINEIWELRAPADLANGNWVLTRLTPVSAAGSYPDRIADSVLTDNGYYAWRGAAGKWKYIPDWDVFLGIYHPVNGDVWAYRPTQPAPSCSYALSPGSTVFGAAAGNGTVDVAAPSGCAWAASSSAPWLTVTSGSSGLGNGSVGFAVAANDGPLRAANLTIGGQTVVIMQASDCTYSVSPSSIAASSNAETGTISVTSNTGCTWTAVSSADWLTVTAAGSGTGNGTVGFAVAANTGLVRMATLTVGSQSIDVTQAALYVPPNTNVALQTNGGVATASSMAGSGFVPLAVNNGDRKGANCNAGGCWVDGTAGVWPDWVQVTFNGPKTIDRVEVFTLQDNWTTPVEPTAAMTFASYGVVDFEVQYWTGSVWAAVPNGTVVGNNKVWRTISFPALTTDRIRIWVSKALTNYSRITEIEAWTPGSGAGNVVPTVSLTSPVGGSSYAAPADVMLTATAADVDGTVAKVEFYAGGAKLGEVLSAPYAYQWSGVAAGTYSLTAVATDNLGATTTSLPVSITVTGVANVVPTVSLTSPVGGSSYAAPADVMLTATAADVDGTVAKVEFYAGGAKLGEVLSAPYAYQWSGVAAGTYSLTAVATDNQGATTTSLPVNMVVTGSVSQSINVALQSNGGVATVSSLNAYPGYVAGAVNNGDRKGANCNAGGCWVDGTAGVWPDWVQVAFNGPKTIDRVEVFTLQDNWTAPVEPTVAMTFASYGVVNFEVQYWTGSAWAAVPNGTVTGNNKVWRTISFPALTTDRIRVWITSALWNNSRITEIEAWTLQ